MKKNLNGKWNILLCISASTSKRWLGLNKLQKNQENTPEPHVITGKRKNRKHILNRGCNYLNQNKLSTHTDWVKNPEK